MGRCINSFLSSSLCRVDDSAGVYFTTAYTVEKKTIENKRHGTVGISKN